MTNNELEVLYNLINVDNKVMHDNITIDDVLKKVNFNSVNYSNSLIIYNGSIDDTKKIINSNINNCILYSNNSYLAINKFLLRNREDLELSTLKNDLSFQDRQDEFDNIIVLNDDELFNYAKLYYKNVKYLEI